MLINRDGSATSGNYKNDCFHLDVSAQICIVGRANAFRRIANVQLFRMAILLNKSEHQMINTW